MPGSSGYPKYGGRGITIAAEWVSDYAAFLAHVGRRPSPKHSIERIDNEKGYEPGNVRWATRKEQARNRRSSRFIEHDGERLTLSEWAERAGISTSLLKTRLDTFKWPMALALLPAGSTGRKKRDVYDLEIELDAELGGW